MFKNNKRKSKKILNKFLILNGLIATLNIPLVKAMPNNKNIKPIKNCYILIVKPNFNISTKKAYLKYDIMFDELEKKTNSDFVENLCFAIEKEKNLKEIKKFLINDFEKVLKNENIIKIKKEMLKKGAVCCSLTGSGSAIFAIFEEKNKAKLAKKFFKKQKLKTFLTIPIKRYH